MDIDTLREAGGPAPGPRIVINVAPVGPAETDH